MKRALLILLVAGCTDALVQPLPQEETTLDDRLTLRGRTCTARPNPGSFPVKIIFLIDSSGSMCISDGPGSQASTGLCETIGAALQAQGITTPGRVRALQSLMQRFANQSNVSVALVPFDSKITNAYPPLSDTGPTFVRANDGALAQRIEGLQNTLGKGTDYQGALAHARNRIQEDIERTDKAALPRTKYVVILLTDGTPYPRCTSNDNASDPAIYADESRPWGVWRDNPATFCNSTDPANADVIEDFVAGVDRNQNYQLFDPIDRLMSLKDQYGIGELRLHTILLFNTEAVQLIGDIALVDLYNGMPSAEAARSVAAWTLTEMAVKHGDGTFQEFTTRASIELGSLDYTSLASRFVQKTLLVSNHFAFPGREGPLKDSDGDGVPDDLDVESALGSHPLTRDSDLDGFPDAFEVARRAEGFDPFVPDPRGCRNGEGFQAKYSCADTDGDLLSQAAEAYLGTGETFPDSDTDGVPDGLEVYLGLDPRRANGLLSDLDLDGVPDVLEVFRHTHPLLDDRVVHSRDGYRYQVTAEPQDDGRVCYDYVVSNIRLVTPASSADRPQGFNFLTVTFAEAPEGGVYRDYGAWKQACAWAQLAPPSLRVPEGPELTIPEDSFRRLDQLTRPPSSIVPTNLTCAGTAP